MTSDLATSQSTNPTEFATNSPSSSPRPSTLRILSWNINGIDPFLPASRVDQKAITNFFSSTKTSSGLSQLCDGSGKSKLQQPSLRGCLRRWGWPHIVCLQEVKISRSDLKTQDVVRREVNYSQPTNAHNVSRDSDSEGYSLSIKEPAKGGRLEEGPQYSAHFSLPRDRHNARGPRGNGKVYGVCTLVRSDIVALSEKDAITMEMDWDLEGRVLLTLVPSPSSPSSSPSLSKALAVFNVYAVNGTTNPHKDSSTGTIIGDRHARKRHFHTLLASSIRSYKEQGYQVVVAGDLNISRTPLDSFPALRLGADHVENRADFEEKFMKAEGGLGMVDSFRHLRGQEQKYTYRPPGKPWGAGMDRVDLILCSRNMIGENGLEEGGGAGRRWSLLDANILDTIEDRGPSDHVPLFIDIKS